MNGVEEFLATSSVLGGFSAADLRVLAACLYPRFYARGSIVFRQGDRGSEIFIVRSGRVGSFADQADGTVRRVYSFGPGAFFGEMAVVENEPRSATCRAEEDSELLVLDGVDFFRLVFEKPATGLRFLNAMGKVMTSWLDESSAFLRDLVRWGQVARRRAVVDDLTGLHNRRFVEESVAARFDRDGPRRLSLVMLDLDRFRDVNAAFGPTGGDEVLKAVAASFPGVLREGDVAARLSGDEFAFLLPDTGYAEALLVAERLRLRADSLSLALPPADGGPARPAPVRASLGVASAPDHADTAAALLETADRALFAAKEGGRDRVVGAGEM